MSQASFLRVRSLHLGCALVGIALFQSGCVFRAVGQARDHAVSYVRGEAQATFDQRYMAVNNAVDRALRELKATTDTVEQNSLETHVVGRSADNEKIDVRVTSLASERTLVEVRVGWMLQDKRSNELLERIRASL